MTRMTMQTATIDVASSVQRVLDEQERSGRWLARKLGKSPAWVQRRLAGEVLFSSVDIQLVADALGVPVSVFFGERAA